MIEQLADHGVHAADLAPSLITTRTIPNPNYDPIAAQEAKEEADRRRLEEEEAARIAAEEEAKRKEMEGQVRGEWEADESGPPTAEPTGPNGEAPPATVEPAPNLISPHPHSLPGVSTTLTTLDPELTLDIRWTVLCDLFLAVIADSVYDARSRVLLLKSAAHLGIGRMDVVRFERRLTEALEVQEGITSQEAHGIIEDHRKKDRKRRYMMMGAAAVGGGLVIGLSAGLLAPVIGAGLAAGFTTIGVTGTSGFLAGAGGAAVITTAGTVTGMNIGGKGMAKRTRAVSTFRILPLHNNKRVNVYMTMPG